MILRVLLVVIGGALLFLTVGRSQEPERGPLSGSFTDRIDHPAIGYSTTPADDPVAQLNRRIRSGGARLESNGASRYLRSLLQLLDIPISSQIVVFSPGSVQERRITPRNPRTLFFNDSVVVGWVGGGFIEVAAQDPRRGVVFYTLDEPFLFGQPALNRKDGCLACHYSYSTVGVPGMLLRSVDQYRVDHRIPLERRWGGWYVTGKPGSIWHVGNVPLDNLYNSSAPASSMNLGSLEGRIDGSAYLSAHSDIAALLVFEHQMHMMNLLSRIGWEARVNDRESIPLADGAREVVDYLLFVEEADITSGIQGSTTFAADFAARGPTDSKGRSLRQLDLQTRLMRYPCSYMIYSDQFSALPLSAKNAIYQRMWQILSGQERDRKYSRLSRADRLSIVEILRETKTDLPAFFQVNAIK